MSHLTSSRQNEIDRAIDVTYRDGNGRLLTDVYVGAGSEVSLISDETTWGPRPFQPVAEVVGQIAQRLASENLTLFVKETCEPEFELDGARLEQDLTAALSPVQYPASMPMLSRGDSNGADPGDDDLAPTIEHAHLNRVQLASLACGHSQGLPASWGKALFSPSKTLSFTIASADQSASVNVNSAGSKELCWTPTRSGIDVSVEDPSAVLSKVSTELAAFVDPAPADAQTDPPGRQTAPDPDAAKVAFVGSSLVLSEDGMIVGISAEGFVDAGGQMWTVASTVDGAEVYEPTSIDDVLGLVTNHFGDPR